MFNSDYIYNRLRSGVVTVDFTKVDGTKRTMRCTLSADYLPEKYRETPALTETTNVMRAYDLDIQAWRSFKVDSVIAIA